MIRIGFMLHFSSCFLFYTSLVASIANALVVVVIDDVVVVVEAVVETGLIVVVEVEPLRVQLARWLN